MFLVFRFSNFSFLPSKMILKIEKWPKMDLFAQKWCWEAQLWLKTNYGSLLKKCWKWNFDVGPIFLAQNSRFWPKMAIFGQFLDGFLFIKWPKSKINNIPPTESLQIVSTRILFEEFCVFCFLAILLTKNRPQIARKWTIKFRDPNIMNLVVLGRT